MLCSRLQGRKVADVSLLNVRTELHTFFPKHGLLGQQIAIPAEVDPWNAQSIREVSGNFLGLA